MAEQHCEHERLYFGSGDYYVFCAVCGRAWRADDEDGDKAGCIDGERVKATD